MRAESEQLVRAAYHVLLNREAEPAGLNHWTNALENGLARQEFLRAMISSAEFRDWMGEASQLGEHNDVDLVIPVQGRQFRVPTSDLSLVPHLLKYRSWEPHLTRYLTEGLQKDEIFMDVGANLGFFTVICAPLARRVIAFEPVAMTHGYCKANVALNGFANVELFHCGLWHEDATAAISIDPSCLMGSSISAGGGIWRRFVAPRSTA